MNRRPRVVYGVSLIRRMVEQGEAAAVTAGLRAIAQSDQRDEVEAYSGAILACWLPALATNQRFLALDLSSHFDAFDIPGLLDAAKITDRQTGENSRQIVIREITDTLAARVRRAVA